MAKSVILYNLLISCPGDVASEITLINKAVDEFNSLYSEVLGIIIQTKHWSKDSYPTSGDRPQALLNEQFVKTCDAAVAVFWTRFGTPTDNYGSGTEEEIEIMLKAGKQLFLYFSDKPISPSQHNPEEYARVKAFQEKHKGDILYGAYSSDDEFFKKFFAHLSLHFLAEKRISEIKEERKSHLFLKGISKDGKLVNNPVYQKYHPNTADKISSTVAEIKKLFDETTNIHLPCGIARDGSVVWLFKQPVTISDDWKSCIELTAEKLNIALPEDFFFLGDLVKDTVQSYSLLGEKLEGTDEEKRKYKLLKNLYKNIIDLLDWINVSNSFPDLMCIKLALSNRGTLVDEDVDVTLRFPRRSFQTLDELPQMKVTTMEHLVRHCDMASLLGIPDTAEYRNYASSQKQVAQSPSYYENIDLPGLADYVTEYKNALIDVFGYNVYIEGDECIVKLKFDYIKHHTTVSFPAAIFLKEKIDAIPYTITSKNTVDIVEGELVVEYQ